MWEAGGGPSIGSVEVIYTAIPDFVKAYFPQFQRSLKEALDFEVKGHLDATGYTEIAQGMLQKRLVFTFGYDNGWLEPDDYLYPYFHTDGPKNSFNLSDPTLDGMLEAQREEFDRERRRELVYDIQRYLLDNVVARLDWVSAIDRGTRWPYARTSSTPPGSATALREGQHVAGQQRPHLPGPPDLARPGPASLSPSGASDRLMKDSGAQCGDPLGSRPG